MTSTHIKSWAAYQETYNRAQSEPDAFWAQVAAEYNWRSPWDKISSGDFNDLKIKWFEGATLNITENCLDRHLKTRADKPALIFEANNPDSPPLTLTYSELHARVCQVANVLKGLGVHKGDRVCFYMGMVPELLIGVLACARLGAVHSVIFGGFSAHALAGRIQDCGAKILMTNDGSYRGAKTTPLKDIADEALESCPGIEKVIVSLRTGQDIKLKEGRDVLLHELIQNVGSECQAVAVESEDPLFILYTSGSTGKPKGLLHTTAGYMVWTGYTFKNVFQMDEDDIYWCTADIGWITGHSYIAYGPLLNGATTVMFEGIPTWPDAGRFWQVIEKLNVTHFYTAPTAIRSLMTAPNELVTSRDLTSLQVLGSVGEPINEEAWEWYNEIVGKKKCPIVDTWWQTETGGVMISPLAGITPTIPAHATHPLPGVLPLLVDPEGKEVSTAVAEGNLCINRPWPGIARTIYGDHDRYRETYFSTYKGRYFTGDGAKRDAKGNYRITGRVDDVINVSGHRIGTAEVEEAINEHDWIVESAVVGYPHDIKGQGIYAYVIATHKIDDEQKFQQELNAIVTKMIGPIAKPDKVQVVSALPKTRSGKIMRRILRKVAAKEFDGLGDTSTLLNPEIVDELKAGAKV